MRNSFIIPAVTAILFTLVTNFLWAKYAPQLMPSTYGTTLAMAPQTPNEDVNNVDIGIEDDAWWDVHNMAEKAAYLNNPVPAPQSVKTVQVGRMCTLAVRNPSYVHNTIIIEAIDDTNGTFSDTYVYSLPSDLSIGINPVVYGGSLQLGPDNELVALSGLPNGNGGRDRTWQAYRAYGRHLVPGLFNIQYNCDMHMQQNRIKYLNR